MFIFVLQAVWLHIKELAGKELDLEIIFKFLVLVSPRLIVLVLPLTILLASIMVFGKFAENYEFAAMKSTGISLQRSMRTLSVFIAGLSIVTFFFANDVIPAAEFEFYSLRRNIAQVKPSLAIAEGQFNQLGPLINIKVSEKSGENGEFLKDVVIHQKENEKDKKNKTIIVSKTGKFVSDEGSNEVKLILFDGYVYQNIESKNAVRNGKNKTAHIKNKFKVYTYGIDLSELNDVDFTQKSSIQKSSMLTIKALSKEIDTLKAKKTQEYDDIAKNMIERSRVLVLNSNYIANKDSLFENNNILKLFNTQQKVQILSIAINSSKNTLNLIEPRQKKITNLEKDLNKHVISYYDKFALGLMCIVLFFVGAPLGALIKKGGIGLPIIVAVLLFLTYHFIGIFAKNSAEDGSINPTVATWLSTLIMLPLSIYLTSRATKDRPILDLGELLDPLKNRFSKPIPINQKDNSLLDTNSEAYSVLNNYSDEKLIDLVKNFHQKDIKYSYKNTALLLLNNRGFSEQELKFGGNLINQNYVDALRYKSDQASYSKISFLLYVCYAISGAVGLILNNNGFPILGKVLTLIGGLTIILFFITLIRSFINESNFNKLLNKNTPITSIILLVLLGIPLYFIYYFLSKNKMNQDLKQIH